jgi:hypothetical protein
VESARFRAENRNRRTAGAFTFELEPGKTMPILSYFAVVGSVLMALLFVADATLPERGPAVVSSNFYGMPKPWRPDPAQTLAATPAPAPYMTSEAVLAAMPKAEPVNERLAEAAPKKKRVARKSQPNDTRQNYAWSRNGDAFGGGGMFGRF